MRLLHRPLRAGGAAVLGLATIALTGAFAASGAQASTAAPAAATPALVALSGSLPATSDQQTGAYTASRMTVEVALAPRDEAGLNAELRAVYTKSSPQYGKFLRAGQFDARYAPTTATRNSVEAYLRDEGLAVSAGSSPFVIDATGSSARITAAFHTTLRNYVDPHHIRYFSNSTSVRLPSSVVSGVEGVLGLSNTVRLQWGGETGRGGGGPEGGGWRPLSLFLGGYGPGEVEVDHVLGGPGQHRREAAAAGSPR